METPTDTPTTSSGLFGFISNAANKVTNAIKGTDQNVTNAIKSKDPNENPYSESGLFENKIGGARSRRRKCNKKHRHTKSCRKYVKKGRKTRKH
jgi:hypothetical protein